jgi:hypothetical protein
MKGRSCPVYRQNLRLAEDLARAGRRLRRSLEVCEQCPDETFCRPRAAFPPELAEALRLAAAELAGDCEEEA